MNMITRFFSVFALSGLASMSWGAQAVPETAAANPPPAATVQSAETTQAPAVATETAEIAQPAPVAAAPADEAKAPPQAGDAPSGEQLPGPGYGRRGPPDSSGYASMRRDSERRREAMRSYREQKQRAIQAQRRWMNPRGEYRKDMSDARRRAMHAQREAQRQQMEQTRRYPQEMGIAQQPYGWNNPWYYRGY